MENSYKENIFFDEKLNRLIGRNFDELESLSYEQIEKIVFYLKSIHSYNDKCERTWANHDAFQSKLEKLRNSAEQVDLMRKSTRLIRNAMLLQMLNGIIFALGFLSLFFFDWYWTGLIFSLLAYMFYKADLNTLSAVLVNKEQDRRYFLSSIRLAENCTELDWCGFFAYYEGFQVGFFDESQTKIHDRNVDVISRNFRDALYNDEFLPWLDFRSHEPQQN